jgi:hypothetical protein
VNGPGSVMNGAAFETKVASKRTAAFFGNTFKMLL